MELIEWLKDQGQLVAYVILFLGSLVEGESFVLSAGYLAFKEYLDFRVIVFLAFLGSWVADQSLYFAGRYYGPGLIDRNPSWKPAANRAFSLLHRYKTSFIFFFRFVYGIRTISPLMIGASGISIVRFSVINFIAAIIWALASCWIGYLIGYYFSHEIEATFDFILRQISLVGMGLLAMIVIGVIWHFWHARRK